MFTSKNKNSKIAAPRTNPSRSISPLTFMKPANMASGFLLDNGALLVKAAAILASVCFIYYRDLSVIFSNALEFTTGNITNYVLIVPLLAAFIIYRKRNILSTVAMPKRGENNRALRQDDILGIAICIISIIFYIAASDTLYALEYHILSLPLFIAGSTLLLFNMATLRHSIVAILITLFLQPPPGQLVSELAADLSWTSAILVEGFLGSIGLPIMLDTSFGAPALVITSGDGIKTPFFVGEPSSGVFSTIGLSLFAIFVAYIVRGPVWKRTLLFLSGFPIFYLLNALRIAFIILLWHVAGPEASEAYHVVSGAIMVAIGSLLILIAGEKLLKLKIKSFRKKAERCDLCDKSLKLNEQLCLFCGQVLGRVRHTFTQSTWEKIAALFFITLVTVGVTASSTLQAEGTAKRIADLDITTIDGPAAKDYFFPSIEGWESSFAFRDTRIESILNQDAAIAYRYTSASNSPTNQGATSPPPLTTSVYTSVQISTGHHVWEDSLVSYPSRVGRPAATILESSDVAISDDKQGRFLLFKRVGSDSIEAVIYWFERTPLKLGSTFENRNVLISIWANTEALTRSQAISGPADSAGIKQLYLSLAIPIHDHWQAQSLHLSTGAALYSFFSENLGVLIPAIAIPTAIFLIHHQIRQFSLSRKLYRLYRQLISEDKFFVDSLMPSINRTKLNTGYSIFRTYQTISGIQHFGHEQILEKLDIARRSGLVRNKIASINDEPLLIWETNFSHKREGESRLKGILGKFILAPMSPTRHNVNNQKGKSD